MEEIKPSVSRPEDTDSTQGEPDQTMNIGENNEDFSDAEIKQEDSVDEEEEALAPAEITAKRESHAPQVDVNQLHKEPDFAVVCSFFNKFGSMIGMKPLSFTKLESLLTSFEADGHVNKELMDIHMTLMRRIRMLSVRAENWENYLKKFLATNEITEGELFQVERYGYVNLPVSSKIQILKALCDAQFDFNPRLKESMSTASRANILRLIPLGMDKNGLVYWFQQDVDFNIRLYTEQPDDQSGATWSLAVRTPEELDELIARLKAEDLGYVKKETDGKTKTTDLNADPEAQMPMSTKKGTFVDLHLDEAAIKRMREFLLKQKEERKMKREGRPKERESEKEEEPEEEEVVDEDLDKRIMPRRSAASRAVSNMRKFVTPSRKSGPRKKKVVEDEDGEEEEKESGGEEKEGEKKESSEAGSGSDQEDEDEEEGDFSDEESEEEDDDEFKPKSAKSKRKRRKRMPKKKKEVDDEDEDDDSDEEEVKKERKVATGESACGQCKKSGDWDVLLLCDVCDDAWHTYCLKPMLWFVPDGDWFCPKCVHGMLIEKLEEVARVLGENLKKKNTEEKKKKAAADRLRREMEYIGVSLNNIIPVSFKQTAIPSSSSSDEDTTQRRSKRKAVKKIAPRSRFQMEVIKTIAEGRSRRRTNRVDYNFKEYDEAIQSACVDMGDKSRDNSPTGEVVRPTGGAGRGKDMANILEAEQKRRASVDEAGEDEEGEENEGEERMVGAPAKTPKAPKHKRKLNDLKDDEEESDSEEYQANQSEEEAAAEEEAMSGSEYVPSGDERRLRSGGGRGRNGPTASDEEFVVSDSDGSYGYRSNKQKKRKEKPKKKKKRGRWESSEESEEEEEEESDAYSDDSTNDRKRKKAQAKNGPKGKWKAAESEEEEEQEDEEELEVEESDEDAPKTQSGRPMRKTVAESSKVEESDEEEEEDKTTQKLSKRPVGALDRVRKKGSDSEGEFQPEDDDEENEEEEDEEEEEDLPPVLKKTPLKKGVKRRVESSDDDEEEEEVPDSKRLAPAPKMMRRAPPLPKPPVEPKTAEAPAKEAVPEKITAVETKPLIKPPTESTPAKEVKPLANGAAAETPKITVKTEPEAPPASGEYKPIVAPAAPESKSGPPQPMVVPSATFAGPMPPGQYPPHPSYYQAAGQPPLSGAPPFPPGRMPPGGPYPPYGAPPGGPQWQPGPYGPPPQAHIQNPYAHVHNPYAQPPAPTSSANTYSDLQSL